MSKSRRSRSKSRRSRSLYHRSLYRRNLLGGADTSDEKLVFDLDKTEDCLYGFILISSDNKSLIKFILISSKPQKFRTDLGLNQQ
jgi:hypothetical protein